MSELIDLTKRIQLHVGTDDDGDWGLKTATAVARALGLTETPSFELTVRIALELLSHEGLVQEAYKDSKGIWTWGIGVTNKSGHTVHPRYLDNPQSIEHCIAIYIWLLRSKYIPEVKAAFAGMRLSEAQFGAALSFHYNTGAIGTATWVQSFKLGKVSEARKQIMDWRIPKEIIARREKERDLFFDGEWSADGKINHYPVRKPSYAPDWGKVRRIDIQLPVMKALTAA